MAQVPITSRVLQWAVDESGYSLEELVAKTSPYLHKWMSGEKRPTVGELRKLARVLKRPLATFLLPAPPADPLRPSNVEFRHPCFIQRSELNPDERRAVRDALRQQAVLSWLVAELGLLPAPLPRFGLKSNAAESGEQLRTLLKIPVQEQEEWPSASKAFRRWRDAIEGLGIFVFVYPMGGDSCRGFSIWDERAPVIAVNSGWNIQARIFSLMHELGHLVTRTNSACLEQGGSRFSKTDDAAERWCEAFAAPLLVPEQSPLRSP